MFERIFYAMMATLCISVVVGLAVLAYAIHPALAVVFVVFFGAAISRLISYIFQG